jgi:hypothetical protein
MSKTATGQPTTSPSGRRTELAWLNAASFGHEKPPFEMRDGCAIRRNLDGHDHRSITISIGGDTISAGGQLHRRCFLQHGAVIIMHDLQRLPNPQREFYNPSNDVDVRNRRRRGAVTS